MRNEQDEGKNERRFREKNNNKSVAQILTKTTIHLFCVLEYVDRLLFILYTRYQQLMSEINAFVSKMDNSIKHTILA